MMYHQSLSLIWLVGNKINIIAFVLNILRNSLKKYFCLSRRLQLKPGKIGNKFMKYNNQEQYNNRSADTWRYN